MDHRRKRCSPVGEAWGGGGRGARSSSMRSGGVRSGVTESSGDAGLGGAGQELRCRSGSVGSAGGWGGRARGWSVGCARVSWAVGSK
jgi:hypothetical protein